ncbi:MAG: hypothetical protein HY020_01600 [Burkholderiales bacterium]|nr:hypothetical protein [Burkholderiales bacterium]
MNHHFERFNTRETAIQSQPRNGAFAPPITELVGRNTTIVLALIFLLSPFAAAHAAPTTLKGSLDRLGVTTVGSGVADATKYTGDDLKANTKQADDYAKKYSKDYTLFTKYEIVYEDAKLDTTASTIIFSMPTFRTLPIPLTKVTGDFDKNTFTRFEFEADKWYPDLEKNYAIKNVSFKGFIDISDPAKPIVDITSVYEWQEVFKEGTLIQPLATLTYKTTAKANPGLGEWNPYPPGPAALVPEPLSSTMLLAGIALLASRAGRAGPNRAGRDQ